MVVSPTLDLNGALPHPDGSYEPGLQTAGDHVSALPPNAAISASFQPAPPAAPDAGRSGRRVILALDKSNALREQLISELKEFRESDALTVWAQRILALKNQLTTSDAQAVETVFAAKLNELDDDAVAARDTPDLDATLGFGGNNETATANGRVGSDREPIPASEKSKPARKLNGSRVPRRAAENENGSVVTSEAPASSPLPRSANRFGCGTGII
jgi:hypothetical protein